MGYGACTIEQWLGALAGPQPTPAGGSLALLTAAGAAALVCKVARLCGVDQERFAHWAAVCAEAADEDATAYRTAAAGGKPARLASLATSLRHLEAVTSLLEGVGAILACCGEPLRADLAAAEGLARAAARVLSVNFAVNLSAWGDGLEDAAALAGSFQALQARLEQA